MDIIRKFKKPKPKSGPSLIDKIKTGAKVANKGIAFAKAHPEAIKKGFAIGSLLVSKKLPSMKEGGVAKETKPHILHKGEMVIPAHLVKHFSGLMKK